MDDVADLGGRAVAGIETVASFDQGSEIRSELVQFGDAAVEISGVTFNEGQDMSAGGETLVTEGDHFSDLAEGEPDCLG